MIAFLLVLAVGFLTVFVLGTIWINFNSLPNWVRYIALGVLIWDSYGDSWVVVELIAPATTNLN